MVTVTVPPGATVAELKDRVALGSDCADVGRMPVKATTPVIEATMMAAKAILSIISLASSLSSARFGGGSAYAEPLPSMGCL